MICGRPVIRHKGRLPPIASFILLNPRAKSSGILHRFPSAIRKDADKLSQLTVNLQSPCAQNLHRGLFSTPNRGDKTLRLPLGRKAICHSPTYSGIHVALINEEVQPCLVSQKRQKMVENVPSQAITGYVIADVIVH